MRSVLKSKIHRAWVTEANADYIGSVVIDRALMRQVDLWDFEQVVLCNVNNGERWETYVLPGEEGSGEVSVQGAGARLCMKGDCLIILAYQQSAAPVVPKMVLVDEQNRFLQDLAADQHVLERAEAQQLEPAQ